MKKKQQKKKKQKQETSKQTVRLYSQSIGIKFGTENVPC